MEPFRGKASGKTFEACPVCGEQKGAALILQRRVAEQEAELEAFRGKPSGKTTQPTCEWCYGPLTGTIHHIEHYRALHLALERAEAELADGYACHVAAHQLLEERAEKAEAELAEWSLQFGSTPAADVKTDFVLRLTESEQRAEKAEAEVERLSKAYRSFETCPCDACDLERRTAESVFGVNPSGEPLGGGGRESESLSSGKAAGKTSAICPPHNYGSNVCRICGEPRPAARKERDG